MVSELWVAVEAVLNDDVIPADTWSEVSTVFLVWVDDDCLELALPPLLLLQRASLVDFAIMIKNRDNRITLSGCKTMLLTCAWQLRCILEYKCRRFIKIFVLTVRKFTLSKSTVRNFTLEMLGNDWCVYFDRNALKWRDPTAFICERYFWQWGSSESLSFSFFVKVVHNSWSLIQGFLQSILY